MMLKAEYYQNTGCTGTVYSSRHIPDGSCSMAGSGDSAVYVKYGCDGGNYTITSYDTAGCTGNVVNSASNTFGTCNTYEKYVSCVDMTTYTIAQYNSSDCGQANLQTEMQQVTGCNPSGRADNGVITSTASTQIHLHGDKLEYKSYNASFDCTGTYQEVEMTCGGVCVNGSTSDLLPDGSFFAYTGACQGAFSQASQMVAFGAAGIAMPLALALF